MENSLTRCPVLRTLIKSLALIGILSSLCYADPSGPAGNYVLNSSRLSPNPSTLNVSSATTRNLILSTVKLGPVTIIHSSGTYDVYSATDTTPGAYGSALVRSFSSWTDNMELRLGPGVFDMGENYLTLYNSTRTSVIGSGKNLTRLKFSGPGYAVQPSSFCYIANIGWSGSGAGFGGLEAVTGTSIVLDNVDVDGSQDAIALNGNYHNISIIDSDFGTTFDGMVFVNTNSTASVNIQDSRFRSKNGSINASGVQCYGVGIVNSYNNTIEVKDATNRIGYGNGGGLGSCRFNIYGGSIETYNGGTDIITYGGSANVTSNLVYISSKTSGTINQLNQTGTTDTSQVYRTTTTPSYPYGMTVSSDGVTFNVNTAGISGFVGGGKSFSISTDEGSSISVSETYASMYANQNVSLTGESNASIIGLTGVTVGSNNSPIVLNPNYQGGVGGSVTVKDILSVNDANSSVDVYIDTIPKNGGLGSQVVSDNIWNKTNLDGSTQGSFFIAVATTPRQQTAGGAPYIPAPGSVWSFTPGSMYFSTYTASNPYGEIQWYYGPSGLLINNDLTATRFIGDGSSLTNIPSYNYSSTIVSTSPATLSTATATSYQSVLSSVTTTSFNWQDGDAKTITLTASSTYTFRNVPTGTNSKTLNVRVINPSTYKMTWPSSVKWPVVSGTAVTGSSPTASGVTILTFQSFDGTVYGAYVDGYAR